MDLDINKLFDDVFVYKRELAFSERKQIVNKIMDIRDLIGAKTNVKEDEYHTGEDETLVFILHELLEAYGLRFFTPKNLERIKKEKKASSGETWLDVL